MRSPAALLQGGEESLWTPRGYGGGRPLVNACLMAGGPWGTWVEPFLFITEQIFVSIAKTPRHHPPPETPTSRGKRGHRSPQAPGAIAPSPKISHW